MIGFNGHNTAQVGMVFLVFQKLSCLPYVFAVSVLACAKSAHVFQKLSYSLCGLCLSFLTNNSFSDSKAFLRFIAFSTVV